MASILGRLLVPVYLMLLHPFFISMTDVLYNSQSKELEISVRLFTDDFENTLRKYHATKIDLLHPADQQQMNAFVNAYVQQHLLIKVNGKPAVLSFLGYEQQEESIWTYLEIKNVDAVQRMEISNTLLHDYNTSQINMMHVKVKDKEQSDKLDYPNAQAVFTF